MAHKRTIRAALETMKAKIQAGTDWSEAAWQASQLHKVSNVKLEAAYDKGNTHVR